MLLEDRRKMSRDARDGDIGAAGTFVGSEKDSLKCDRLWSAQEWSLTGSTAPVLLHMEHIISLWITGTDHTHGSYPAKPQSADRIMIMSDRSAGIRDNAGCVTTSIARSPCTVLGAGRTRTILAGRTIRIGSAEKSNKTIYFNGGDVRPLPSRARVVDKSLNKGPRGRAPFRARVETPRGERVRV